MGPAVAALLVCEPISLRDGGGLRQAVRRDLARLDPLCRLHALVDGLAIDAGIDDEMDDMDILRPELARHDLGHRAKCELRRGKRGKPLATANAGSRAGKENGSASTRQHDTRGFAADEAIATSLVSQGKLGLLGMRERMALVDGTLNIESAPGRGTSIVARAYRSVEESGHA